MPDADDLKYLLAIELGDAVQFLGTSFRIQRPEAFFAGACIVWSWALIRYAQYFRDLGRTSIARAKTTESHRAAFGIIARSLNKQIALHGERPRRAATYGSRSI